MESKGNQPIISVIIPIYNAEAWLETCLDSMKSQQGNDFEVLMVNDGSKDGSEAICARYAAQDSRFRLITQKNQGPSAARNEGLRQAKGKYIQFADSDDAALEGFTSVMLETAEKTQADLVICDFVQQDLPAGVADMRHFHMPGGELSRKEFLRAVTGNPGSHYVGVLWNKLYRRDLIEAGKLRFEPQASLGEDFIFNTRYFSMAETICCLEDRLYQYQWQRADSLCTKAKPEEERIRERVRMYKAYEAMLQRERLAGIWRYRMLYYPMKAYFDELAYLGPEAKAYSALLYKSFVQENGITVPEYLLYSLLKKAKQLRKRK